MFFIFAVKILDLRSIRKKLGTPVKELTPVEKWGLFFSYVDNEEYADYISELVRSEKGIMAAENVVKYMSEADDNWFVQNSRFIAERDKNTQIHNAEKRGHEEGLRQGIQQGIQQGAQQKAIEAAINLLRMKLGTPEQIAQAQDLPLEKVLELQKSLATKA